MQTDQKVNLCTKEAIFGRVSVLSNSDIQIKPLKSTTLRKQIVEIIIQDIFLDNLKTETTA